MNMRTESARRKPPGGRFMWPHRVGAGVEAATLTFLVLAALVAAFIDSIVGGGGVITLPALLAAGLPPHVALGTNKLAATGASFTASTQYIRHGAADMRRLRWWFPLAVMGSLTGAAVVVQVPDTFVRAMVVVVMAAMTLYVLLRPRFGAGHAAPATAWRLALGGAVALAVGFYDGFLGPGTGSLLLFGLVASQGFSFLQAAGNGRVLNFGSNVAALALFAYLDVVDWSVGLPMLAAMVVGGYAGSRFSLRHGARWIRPLFLAITLSLMVRLLWPWLT
jgi:uncharacterized protein